MSRPSRLADWSLMRRCLSLLLLVTMAACTGEGEEEATTTTSLPVATSTAATDDGDFEVTLVDVSELVEAVRDGVVTVSQTRLTFDMFRQPVEVPTGTGTGIVVDEEGRILTNFHVVAGADRVFVYAADGEPRPGRVVAARPEQDLALVRIEAAQGLAPLPLADSDLIEVGDPVVAIGNALGLDEAVPSVSAGIVSAKGRTIQTPAGQLANLIQTDAAINPGNSGGPLVNRNGEVVGVNTAVAAAGQNIGFAIPSNTAKDFLEEALTAAGDPFIGVSVVQNGTRLAARFGLSTSDGLVVAGVLPAGPADDAGLQPGDIILEVDGSPVATPEELTAAVREAGAGSTLTLTVVRGGARGEVEVTVAER